MCVSDAVAERQAELYPCTQPAIVLPGRRVGLTVPVAVRQRFGIVADRPVIGCVGRIEPWKGQDLLVEALGMVHAGGADAHLLLIGEDNSPTWPDFAPRVHAVINRLGLADYITFTGHVREPAAVMAGCDVIVCSSREEGFGLAIVEAMALGVPVVATRCGGPESFLVNEDTALMVAAEDAPGLAAAIGRLLGEPATADELAHRARQTYQTRLTARHSASSFLQLAAATIRIDQRRATP
jgi:glycosyltransferase involved in cell wall biosynthesis